MTPACVARFRGDLERLIPAGDAPLLVAVSGGPDSVALLLTQAGFGARGHAATVDHGLREAARGEAAWVGQLCAARGIGHAVLTGAMPARSGGTANLSARARALRYALLAREADRIGAVAILTAHHADDQAETVMMRLNRVSGVGGLAGVRAGDGCVLRPLLGWRRAELARIVAAAGIAAVDDPSNRDDRFDRARMRRHLADAPWIDPLALATSAALLGEAEAALAWSAARLIAERVRERDDAVTFDATDLPDELARRLVGHCLQRVDPDASPRGGQVARAAAALRRGETVMLGDALCRADSDGWYFSRAPARRSIG